MLPMMVAADWRLWAGPCDTGLYGPSGGSMQSPISPYNHTSGLPPPTLGGNFGTTSTGKGGCDGCGATGAGGGYADFESGNPCNCEDLLQYKWNDGEYRVRPMTPKCFDISVTNGCILDYC